MTLLPIFGIIFTVFHENRIKIITYTGKSMTVKEKLKIYYFKRYWKKQGKKDLFTWIHRYLRLHSDLLTDSLYQSMYDYHRNTLITYLKNDINKKKLDDVQLGQFIDVLADIFNKNNTQRVNKYQSLVEELYKFWTENKG